MRRAVETAVARYAAALGADGGHTAVWWEHLATGEVVQLDAEEVYPAASVIKIPILVEAFRQAEEGKLFLESLYSVHEGRRAGGSGVFKEFHAGLEVTLRDILTFMIIVSDNTATNLAIDLAGMPSINDTIRRLGLRHTALRRRLMGGPFYDRPDYSLAIDNILSAVDMGLLLRLLARGQAVSATSDAAMLDILLRQQVNDRIPMMLPRGVRVAHKTGEFQTTRHDAGVVYGPDGPAYVLVVLTRGLKRPPKAVWQIAELSEEIYKACAGGGQGGSLGAAR
ncbi:MAG: serine hydrolase [Bacillota bacterium]|nr:serine hydrolase [Bacillota bacterium]